MIHLNTRSGYSFLKAFGTPKQIVDRAKSLGLQAVGVADYCSTWSHIQFQKECKKAGIKPLFGVLIPVCLVLDKDPRHDLVCLIAKSSEGLRLIYKAVGRARAQMYYRPRLTWGQVHALRGPDVEVIVEHVRLATQDIVRDMAYPVALRPVANHILGGIKSGDLKPIAALGAAYPVVDLRASYQIARTVQGVGAIGEVELEPFHMMSQKEYEHALRQLRVSDEIIAAALSQSELFAAGISAVIPTATNVEPPGSLEELCVAGSVGRGLDVATGPYADRLQAELAVIRAKKFESYFLFVEDLIRWAKARMLVGPGRGSAGGSLVCYLLGITEVDPLVHGTLFERFIDITRNDWPDIDIDFPDVKRQEVVSYLIRRWGADKVAKLGTVTELGGKSALNDMARALKVPWETTRLVSKMVTDDMTLEKAFEEPGVQAVLEQFPNLRNATLLEGQPRQSGVHAAGIVVSSNPITDYASVDDENVAAMTMKDAEDIGLLKMDALGLRTLSVIETCCEAAGLDPAKLYALPLTNTETYDLIARDMLTGVFQFEGGTVRGLTRQIKVDRFSDLCALTSLARPGPLEGGAAGNWVKRRNGEEEVKYEHPALEKYLSDTYGTVVYQEQMMNIVRHIGAFSIEDTNKFRRAIGKKLPEELKKFQTQFLENAGRSVGEKVAKSLWHQMEESGSYAFNFSHAVAYSMLSYFTAWLKAHYPLEFGLAQLVHTKGEEHARALIQELERDGMEIVPFDPARSDVNWSIRDNALIGGFTVVKGIGEKTAIKIVEARDSGDPNWMLKLGDGVVAKLTNEENWAWADPGRIQRKLNLLYSEPDRFITKATPVGVSGAPIRIADIKEGKGQYKIAGIVTKKMLRNSNDPERVAKRGGTQNSGPEHFLNLFLDDGTGEIGVTINRFKYDEMGKALWENPATEGRLVLLVGSCINSAGRWLMVDKIVDVHDWLENGEPSAQPTADNHAQ